MDDKIRGFVQSGIARVLVERLFSLSGFNVRISAEWMFGTPTNIGQVVFGDDPYFVIQPKRGPMVKTEYIDVRFRGNGGLYSKRDKQYVERWREWNEKHPLTVIVVSPYEPHFQAVRAPFFGEDDMPLNGITIMDIPDWTIKPDVHEACARLLLEYLPPQWQ